MGSDQSLCSSEMAAERDRNAGEFRQYIGTAINQHQLQRLNGVDFEELLQPV